MNTHRKKQLARALCGSLAACLIALSGTAAAAAAAVESNFHTYDLSDNSIGAKEGDRFISRADARADLDVLEKAIQRNSSYMWSSTFDYRKTIEQISASLPERVSVNGLSTQLSRFVHLFGDDHARVLGWKHRIPQAGVAFQIGKAGARYFLYTLSPADYLDADYPYVRAIDGVSISEWMRTAGDLGQGPLSTKAARFQKAQGVFPYIDYLRAEMGLPTGGPVSLELVSEDGTRSTTRRVPLQEVPDDLPDPFFLPDDSRMLPNNIGYLRVPAHSGPLSEKVIHDIPRLMEKFRDTDALIIDARQCGGGKRAVLNALFPYFMPADSAPYIFNVIKLRTSQVEPGQAPEAVFDDSAKRFQYVDDPKLSKADAAAYREFAKDFIPSWEPPADKFTGWYFMALRPQPDKPYYGKHVYVMIDWGVGSAGDIFSSAFKSWPGITMVGTPTMGRSGQSKGNKLPHSHLDVVLSTMASFQKTGERYDTVGIHPDIDIKPIPSDWIGKTDSVLDRLRALIAERLGKSRTVTPAEHAK